MTKKSEKVIRAKEVAKLLKKEHPIRASIMVGKLPEDLKALLPEEE